MSDKYERPRARRPIEAVKPGGLTELNFTKFSVGLQHSAPSVFANWSGHGATIR